MEDDKVLANCCRAAVHVEFSDLNYAFSIHELVADRIGEQVAATLKHAISEIDTEGEIKNTINRAVREKLQQRIDAIVEEHLQSDEALDAAIKRAAQEQLDITVKEHLLQISTEETQRIVRERLWQLMRSDRAREVLSNVVQGALAEPLQ